MSFAAGRSWAATLIVSLLIQMHTVENSYASREGKIAFSSIGDTSSDIFVMDRLGRNQRQVTTDPANDQNPTWSPDGEKIAFVSSRNKGHFQIWVIDTDGKNPVRLTHGFLDNNPAWSPDGKTIAYQSRSQVYIIDVDGNNNRKLTNKGGINPCWSPGGTRIAFVSKRHGDTYQIYVMDSDGQNQTQLTHDLLSKGYPSWSPNGRRIAFVSNQLIYVMNNNGENQRKLTRKGKSTHPTWSPKSDIVAYQSTKEREERYGICTVDVRTRIIKRISIRHAVGDYQPDWYHSGQLSVSPVGAKTTLWGRLKDIAFRVR